MAPVRSGHLVFGVGLVVLGYAVLVIALAEQAQRAAALASVPALTLETSTAPPATAPPATAPPVIPAATTAPTVTPAPTPAPAAAASAAAAPSDATGDVGEARMFKFSPGGAAMSREEVTRLLALGKVLARRPVAKVSIEGFGDRAGTEPLMVGIAKHRAKVAQMLLAKAGVTEDRVTLAFVDMGQDQHLAQTIRITTLPPLSEIEKP
jgi:outer membrane protein OmpA-like peptidoglycan-associated protein